MRLWTRLWRGGVAAAALALLCLPAPSVAQQTAPGCVAPEDQASALSVQMVSSAPIEMCAPTYQIVEIRNRSDANLGDVSISVAPPLGVDKVTFPGELFDISDDDGATWRRIGAPNGAGTLDDPLTWSVRQSDVFGRLRARGRRNDSILLRWRAAYGHGFHGDRASEARLSLSGAARDTCGAAVSAPVRVSATTLLQPRLVGRLVGRNVTRGGEFARVAPAAPGDLVEWRLEVENVGDGLAREVRARFSAGEGRPFDAQPLGGPDLGPDGLLALGSLVDGGKRTVRFRETVGFACGRRDTRLETSWACRASADSGLSAIVDPAGLGGAVLATRPRPEDLAVTQSVAGVFGAERPGDVAVIEVQVANDGPPVFDLALNAVLPEGYAFDAAVPIELFAPGGGVFDAVVDATRPEAPVIELLGRDGAPSALNPGESVLATFQARRVRSSVLVRDEMTTTLSFRDGCGDAGRAAPVRTDIAPRRADLRLAVDAAAAAIVRGEGDAATFRVTLENTGREAAQGLALQIAAGRGWSETSPDGCVLDRAAEPGSGPEGDGPSFFCPWIDALDPGRRATRDLAFAVGPQEGALSIGVTAVALGATADRSEPIGAVALERQALAQASAVSGAAGFTVSHQMTTAAGRRLEDGASLDIGDQVVFEIAAQWFGGGAERFEDVSLTQVLPPALAFRSAAQSGGDAEIDTVLAPGREGGGQVLWSLEALPGGGDFAGRVVAEVVHLDPLVGRRAAQGSAEASGLFTLRNRSYGVDPQYDAPTRAPSIEMTFRRPEVALELDVAASIDDLAMGDVVVGEALVPDAVSAPGGRTLYGMVRVRNTGAAPAFLDWLEVAAPPFVEIAPLGEDGLDNDGDGVVDDADEADIAQFDPTDGLLRWITLRDSAIGAADAAQRIDAESVSAWPIALRVAPDVTPGAAAAIEASLRHGHAPFGAPGAGERREETARRWIQTPSVEGFLVVTQTSFDSDLSARVRHGESVEHRLSLRFPPGALDDVVAEIAAPAAVADLEVVGLRLGGGVRCDAVEDAASLVGRVSVARNSDGQTLRWSLGDCRVSVEASETDRVALLDVVGRIVDADPRAEPEARAEWRKPTLSARLVSEGEPDGVEIGRSALTVAGPLLRMTVAPPDGAARPDAGDPFALTAVLENVGDLPLDGVRVWLERPTAGGIDCASVTVSGAPDGFTRSVGDDAPQICGPVLTGGAGALVAGDRATFEVNGRLAPTAPIGARIETPVRVAPVAAASAPPRADETSFDLTVAAPTAPSLDAPPQAFGQAAVVLAATPVAVVGDALLMRAEFALPEGRAPAAFTVRHRLRGVRSGPVLQIGAPAVRVRAATLTRLDDRARSSTDPGGVNSAPVGTGVNVAAAIEDSAGADGWRRLTLDMGDVVVGAASPIRGVGRYALELVVALDDAPSASEGRVIEAQAGVALGPARGVRASAEEILGASLDLGRIGEPFIELAAAQTEAGSLDQFGFRGVACNRGSAPAYGLTLRVESSPALIVDDRAPPSYLVRSDAVDLAAAAYGNVLGDGDDLLAVARTPGAAIAPGDCVELRARFRARPGGGFGGGGDGAAPTIALTAERYQGRSSANQPGRIYGGARIDLTPIASELEIVAPRTVDVPVAALRGEVAYPASIAALGAGFPVRFQLSIEPLTGAVWTLHRDLNANGVLDAGEPLWRDGVDVPPGERLAVIARTEPPVAPVGGPLETGTVIAGPAAPAAATGAGGASAAVLRAVAIAPDGATLVGQRELIVRRVRDQDGAVRARRVMAVDRDCDGALTDETTQDSLFAMSKDVSPGECVVMRLLFENEGAAAVENVSVSDQLFDGAAYVSGSARFADTPIGLVAGAVRPPAEDGAIQFGFVGALSPGLRGAVEYRIQLTDG